jgi:DnaJ-class molecular chaperone
MKQEVCKDCGGCGEVYIASTNTSETCWKCSGSGYVLIPDDDLSKEDYVK